MNDLFKKMVDNNLKPLMLRGRELLPVVQGGMGVGISAHKLAGAVAKEGAMGTISSVDLRRHHEDLMAESKYADKETVDRVNNIALDREIKEARKIANGMGCVAVNIMKALSEYAAHVRQCCRSGADAIVVGAGLPLDLPDLVDEKPDISLIPILSDFRGIRLIIKKWARKGRLPDAIVIEHPRYAGGHLGSPHIEDLKDPRFDFENVIPQTQEFFRAEGIDEKQIPLIPAGGINTPERLRQLQDMGASAVQLGTPFAVTQEGDAAQGFKEVLMNAKPEDIVEFVSVAGLPCRAVKNPWLENYLKFLPKLKDAAHVKPRCSLKFDCLAECGLRDGIVKFGQFCIDMQLAFAMRGDKMKGLFFRGANSLPFGNYMATAREVIEYMLTGVKPAGAENAKASSHRVFELHPA